MSSHLTQIGLPDYLSRWQNQPTAQRVCFGSLYRAACAEQGAMDALASGLTLTAEMLFARARAFAAEVR